MSDHWRRYHGTVLLGAAEPVEVLTTPRSKTVDVESAGTALLAGLSRSQARQLGEMLVDAADFLDLASEMHL